MAHSLEVRVPFLDHEILEFVFSLSTGMYFKDGVKKHLLKKNLEKRVSQEVLDMPKRGFSHLHVNRLFARQFENLILQGQLKNNGIIQIDKNSLSKLHQRLKFHLLILELWFRQYNTHGKY